MIGWAHWAPGNDVLELDSWSRRQSQCRGFPAMWSVFSLHESDTKTWSPKQRASRHSVRFPRCERSWESTRRLLGTRWASSSRCGPAATRKGPTPSRRSRPYRPSFRPPVDSTYDRNQRNSARGRRRRRGWSKAGRRCFPDRAGWGWDRRRQTDGRAATGCDVGWADAVAADDAVPRTVLTWKGCPAAVTSQQASECVSEWVRGFELLCAGCTSNARTSTF